MSRARCVVAAAALLCPALARGQVMGTSVELFGTAGAVGGFRPVTAASGSHVDAHAGVRLDGGVQFSRFGLGGGGRYWEMAPADDYGGRGVDVFFLGEWRPTQSLHTTVRATLGAGMDDFDSGHGAPRSTIYTGGFGWSFGVGHEVIAPSGAGIILSADLVMPHTTEGPIGQRSPVFELGVGYRFRFFQPIGPLPR